MGTGGGGGGGGGGAVEVRNVKHAIISAQAQRLVTCAENVSDLLSAVLFGIATCCHGN